MKEKKAISWIAVLLLLFFVNIPSTAQAPGKIPVFDTYHSPDALNGALNQLAGTHAGITKLHRLAVSPGSRQVLMLEIGPETAKVEKSLPAILVAANFEGRVPAASEAALYLAHLVLGKPEVRKDTTWYILPMGNPDASARFFQKPLLWNGRNLRPHNDDMDDQTDEDGVEDLDGNGLITLMRVKDPLGDWLPLPGEPRLMKEADWSNGEKGIYKLYTEGLDNDNDGLYNEDGPGGVNIGLSFPHLFKFFTTDAGPWSGHQLETFNLLEFVFAHPEIAMTFYFGETNFCVQPPKAGRKETADFQKIKIPKDLAERMGFDPDRNYTMDEIVEKAQQMVPPGIEVTPNMVAGFLGLGAAVNPLAPDLKFYNALSEDFKEFLKKNKLDGKRQEPAAAKDGSFELWAYYHLGVPSFSMDLWSLPLVKEDKKEASLTPEKLESMSKEDFLALGEEKIGAFLKSSGAPDHIKAKMVIEMVKAGNMTTKKMAEMLKQMPKPKSKEGADPKEKALLTFNDSELEGKGFVDWKPFKHPTLGEVEIGGIVPYADTTPPASKLDELLKGQVPWIFQLLTKLPRIKIEKTNVQVLGSGLYRVKAWVGNSGLIPYPTAMGRRNNRIGPVTAVLSGSGLKIVEGKKRSLIKSIGGHSVQMVEWLVQVDQPVTLQLKVHSTTAWSDSASVDLRAGGAE